jgi:formate dehydrogenase maturation protein FdhE
MGPIQTHLECAKAGLLQMPADDIDRHELPARALAHAVLALVHVQLAALREARRSSARNQISEPCLPCPVCHAQGMIIDNGPNGEFRTVQCPVCAGRRSLGLADMEDEPQSADVPPAAKPADK